MNKFEKYRPTMKKKRSKKNWILIEINSMKHKRNEVRKTSICILIYSNWIFFRNIHQGRHRWKPRSSNPFSRIPTRITSDFVGIRQNMAGIRSGCMQFRSYPTIGIRLKGFRQLTAEIRPRLFGSDGIRLGIIDLGRKKTFAAWSE